jgi:hypothetical protein
MRAHVNRCVNFSGGSPVLMKATGHKTLAMFQRYNTVLDDDLRALVSQPEVHGQNVVNRDE